MFDFNKSSDAWKLTKRQYIQEIPIYFKVSNIPKQDYGMSSTVKINRLNKSFINLKAKIVPIINNFA